MALDYSKWVASADEIEQFHKAPFDADGARALLVKRITRTLKQLNGEKVAPQGGKDYTTLHNNGILYRPTLNGQQIDLPGQGDEDGFHATRSNLLVMLPEFAKHVEAGEFDDQLKRIIEAGKPAPEAPTPFTTKAPRASTPRGQGLGKVSQPDDPEWMERFTSKYGAAPSDDHVPNSKGTGWVTRARQAATKAAADKRFGRA